MCASSWVWRCAPARVRVRAQGRLQRMAARLSATGKHTAGRQQHDAITTCAGRQRAAAEARVAVCQCQRRPGDSVQAATRTASRMASGGAWLEQARRVRSTHTSSAQGILGTSHQHAAAEAGAAPASTTLASAAACWRPHAHNIRQARKAARAQASHQRAAFMKAQAAKALRLSQALHLLVQILSSRSALEATRTQHHTWQHASPANAAAHAGMPAHKPYT